MRVHPFCVWTLGGIPAGEGSRPSATDIESWVETWHKASDEYLIGVAARAHGQNSETANMPALIESHRRFRIALASFEETSRKYSESVVQAHQLVDVESRIRSWAASARSESSQKRAAPIIAGRSWKRIHSVVKPSTTAPDAGWCGGPALTSGRSPRNDRRRLRPQEHRPERRRRVLKCFDQRGGLKRA